MGENAVAAKPALRPGEAAQHCLHWVGGEVFSRLDLGKVDLVIIS